MTITTRETEKPGYPVQIHYHTIDPMSLNILPDLKEGETLHVHQEVNLLSDNQASIFLDQIRMALKYHYPNNRVIVTAKRNGVNETAIEVKSVSDQPKDKKAGSYWFD